MSFSHHGDTEVRRLEEQLEREAQLRRKLADQMAGKRGERKYSDGRLGADDDGDAAFMIRGDQEKQVVILEFGKPMDWVAMPPAQAIKLAQLLIKHARAISTEAVVVELY